MTVRLLSDAALSDCGLTGETHVLVGLSGGADSVALLHALLTCRAEGRIAAVAAAHLNHGLRGAAADADAAFCAALCDRLRVPYYTECADVRGFAKAQGESIEQAARTLRYDFLRRSMAAAGADCIAVAHHADDQAETVLLHLMRGTGLRGLTGMRPRAGDVARPLLAVTRKEIRAYLAENGLACREDASNEDTAFLRNRIRHELLPLLSEYNKEIGAHLAGTAALLRADEDYLSELAVRALFEAASDGGYDRKALFALPVPVRSRAVKELLCEALDYDVCMADIRRVTALLNARTGTRIELRGGRAAFVDAKRLRFGQEAPAAVFEKPLIVGEPLHVGGYTVFTDWVEARGREQNAFEAYLSADALTGPLTVRARRDGDRFHPLGGPGTRSLSDVLTDRKAKPSLRNVPLLCAGNEILFVPGYTIAESARVTLDTRRVLHIYLMEDTGV